MKRSLFTLLALAAVGAVAGQTQRVWNQEYSGQLAGFESRFVVGPLGFGWRSYDDFEFPWPTGGFVRTIVWYGRVADPKQLSPFRWWQIGVYFPDGCSVGPQAISYRVKATNRRVGIDCRGYPVYRFKARILPTTGFFGHFFISIAEDDATSAWPGKPDFFWSGHRPITGCPALQTNRLVWRNLFDPCDNQLSDLAFEMYSD